MQGWRPAAVVFPGPPPLAKTVCFAVEAFVGFEFDAACQVGVALDRQRDLLGARGGPIGARTVIQGVSRSAAQSPAPVPASAICLPDCERPSCVSPAGYSRRLTQPEVPQDEQHDDDGTDKPNYSVHDIPRLR